MSKSNGWKLIAVIPLISMMLIVATYCVENQHKIMKDELSGEINSGRTMVSNIFQQKH